MARTVILVLAMACSSAAQTIDTGYGISGPCRVAPLVRTNKDDSNSIGTENNVRSVYKIGVLANRGIDNAYARYNTTFADYLTATAGRQFDPPISFQMVPVDFQTLFEVAEAKTVDYLFVNPSAFSCVEAEFGAQTLVSYISKRTVGSTTYELAEFGGVIITKANNDAINTILDLKDKVVAAAAISAFGAGLMQFREMQKAGMSYINDPKQLVFTNNQGSIVNGVLYDDFDAGFIRTDQLENSKDQYSGQPVNLLDFKIIQPVINDQADGEPFPFVASTQLYPEWNLAALSTAPEIVSEQVQASLLALSDHAKLACTIQDECFSQVNKTTCAQNLYQSMMESDSIRCDTTFELSELAKLASEQGKYAGFRITLSYSEIRSLLQDTDFITKDGNSWQCAKPAELYDAITCPKGHFRKPRYLVDSGCEDLGLACNDDFQCVCKPCLRSFDVDVAPVDAAFRGDLNPDHSAIKNNNINYNLSVESEIGCAKMALCGIVEQTKPLVFHAIDNKERDNVDMTVRVHDGSSIRYLSVSKNFTEHHYQYEFAVSDASIGILVMEIFLGDEQIPESPLRVQVVQRDCVADTHDPFRVADSFGTCICQDGTVTIGSQCVSYGVILPSILVPIAVLVSIFVWIYVERKKREADSLWSVRPGELHFGNPPTVIGQGSFGLVLLAEYRGTNVAVKRVLPPREALQANKKKEGNMISRDGNPGTYSTQANFFDYDTNSLDNNSREVVTTGSLLHAVDTALGVLEESDTSETGSEKIDLEKGITKKEMPVSKGKKPSNRPPPSADTTRLSSIEPHCRDGKQQIISRHPSKSGSNDGNSSLGFGNLKSGLMSTSVAKKKNSSGSYLRDMIRSSDYSKLKAEFIAEMRLLSKLRHPCITTVMGAVIAKGETPMLVMEYMSHGSLYNVLHNDTLLLDGELLLPIMRDIAQGIRFLHAANPQVIHGDLKAANILVDSKFRAKVADFGLSQKKRAGAIGTPYWMAPELLRGETSNTAASDMYSIGIILYEVYSRRDPYKGEDVHEVLQLVCDRKVNKRPPIPESCPPKVAKMMKFLLHSDPKLRPTSCELDNRLRELDVENVQPKLNSLSHRTTKSSHTDNRSEFLYQVFPKHIADILKTGGTVEPESHDMVTIFFSDIVGFTNIASSFPPLKVSNMLDRLYLAFDELAQKHDVFKIETVGDAYMCAANLAKPQKSDHAKRIAEFAIDAIKAASNILIDIEDPSRGCIEIRVGFHSGAVVSNVVGSLNPRFGIFGDTVNVASRMESTSEKGRIHCTELSAGLLQRQAKHIPVAVRGNVPVKGKGNMRTFWVNEV